MNQYIDPFWIMKNHPVIKMEKVIIYKTTTEIIQTHFQLEKR